LGDEDGVEEARGAFPPVAEVNVNEVAGGGDGEVGEAGREVATGRIYPEEEIRKLGQSGQKVGNQHRAITARALAVRQAYISDLVSPGLEGALHVIARRNLSPTIP
ncbi:MAG: hypothetical protein JW963_11410, partial [Anaerolineales bacterium]|nr:hypothetical protein [Anaerolineales bacterium]